MKVATLPFVILIVLATMLPFTARSQEKPRNDDAKLETLFKGLERLTNAKFIRNGSTYDAKTACKFLLNKLERHRGECKTALEFIEKHASNSSSGIPYVIRLGDGKEIKCRDYLIDELKKVDLSPSDAHK